MVLLPGKANQPGAVMKKTVPGCIFLLCTLFILAGCTHMSVKHLSSNPVSFDQEEELQMRYWDFSYVNQVENDHYLIHGTAYPRQENLPGWGKWMHNLWITAYLSDEEGRVLARDLKVYPTQELDSQAGVPMEFRLKPEKMPSSEEIFITFGYRMQLTEDRYTDPSRQRPLTGEKSVFFASEKALAR